MNLATVACQKAHALAAVMRAAAAKGNDAVALFLFVEVKSFCNVFVRGVRDSLIVYGILHLGGIKDVGDHFKDTGINDALVSYNQRLRAIDALQSSRNLFGTSLAHQGDVGDKERGDLTHMHALKIRTHS